MRTRETQAGHVGVPHRVDDPRCTRRSQAALVSRAGTERDRASRRAAANASCASATACPCSASSTRVRRPLPRPMPVPAWCAWSGDRRESTYEEIVARFRVLRSFSNRLRPRCRRGLSRVSNCFRYPLARETSSFSRNLDISGSLCRLAQHGRDRDRRPARSVPGPQNRRLETSRQRNRRVGTTAKRRCRPHQMDVHNRQSPRQNGPCLSPHVQRVIITVQRY
jgi:hypothetical protein